MHNIDKQIEIMKDAGHPYFNTPEGEQEAERLSDMAASTEQTPDEVYAREQQRDFFANHGNEFNSYED